MRKVAFVLCCCFADEEFFFNKGIELKFCC